MIYRRYHAAQKAKRAAELASIESDLAEVRGDVSVRVDATAAVAPVTVAAHAPATQSRPPQPTLQHNNQRRDNHRR